MRLLLLLFLLLAVSGCEEETGNQAPVNLDPCGDFSCDTTVLRGILRINSPAYPSLDEFYFTTEGGRINRLEFLQKFTGLRTLPPEIGKLTALRFLNLGGNPITAIPASIGNLENLDTLMIDYGKFTALPPEIGKLKSLRYLIARYCGLKALPPEIGNLASLININLEANRLTSLPPEFGNLSRLVFIDLSNNALDSLPATITGLSPGELRIFANHLCSLPIGTQEWLARVLQDADWMAAQKCDLPQP